MTSNSGVTIYHNSPHNGYIRSFFGAASVFANIGEVNERDGRKKSDVIKIRIPTSLFVELSCGDYVFLGKSDSIVPKKDDCFVIKEFSDNRRGASPHWRILAG